MNEQKAGLQDNKSEIKDSVSVAQETEFEMPAKGAPEAQHKAERDIGATDNDPDEDDPIDDDDPIVDDPKDAGHSIEGLQYKIAVLSEALESAKDKSIRAQAEVENIRRRTANEMANSRKFAVEAFATELLSVKDSLDLAEQVELSADNEDVISKMQEGLSLTLKQLEHIFEKFSIKIISPEIGDRLDPELHQAMTIVASDEIDPNCVLDVIQKGYQLHNRLLRPAMVVIAKKTEKNISHSEE